MCVPVSRYGLIVCDVPLPVPWHSRIYLGPLVQDPGPEQDSIEKRHRSLVEAAAVLSLGAVKHDVRAARRQDDGDAGKPGDRRHSYLPYSDSPATLIRELSSFSQRAS